MFRKILPYLLIIFMVIVDISVVPVFTSSVYVVPLTLIFLMCSAMLLGRTHGVLCGVLGGGLLDILTGYPFGYLMINYVICGFIVGFFCCDSDEKRAQEGYSRIRAAIRRVLTAWIMAMVFESVTMVYQYFNTALFDSVYIGYAVARAFICCAAASLGYYAFEKLLIGKRRARVRIEKKEAVKREVKNL